MSRWMHHPEAKIPAHPLASVVPWMSDDEFLDLRKSIRARGLLPGDEIVMLEGKTLDGRHRYLACLYEGVEPRFRDYTGDDPRGFVLAKLTRRNLTSSTRAMIVAELVAEADAEHGIKGKPADKRQESLRSQFGVGESSVTLAMRTIKHGVPELKQMVENGEIEVRHAGTVARLPKKEQEKVVRAGAESVISKARQLRKADKKPAPPPPSAPGLPEQPPARRFDSDTDELLRDIRNLAAKTTRYIRNSDGKRFAQYAAKHFPGWIDYGKVKLVDDGEGVKRIHATFVALQPFYRLLVAGARDRAFPDDVLGRLLNEIETNVLDGSTPPPEPEDDPANLVTPESL